MECTRPLQAYQTQDGSVIFSDFGRGDVIRSMSLRCGQCMACRITAGAKWSARCLHEAKLYGERNCFVTLTADDNWMAEVFPRGDLTYRPYQKFMYRLRAKLPDKVRFRMSAEYGDTSWRPHYHALLFNFWPDDAKKWRSSGDGFLYRSPELEKLWPYGFAEFGRVTPETAAYVNGYVQKKLTGEKALAAYERVDGETGEIFQLVPPFARQSTVPAIGIPFFERYVSDFVNVDACVLRGGAKIGMPKAYDNWLERRLPDVLDELKLNRELLGREHFRANPGEASYERLAVKDEVNRARVRDHRRGAV